MSILYEIRDRITGKLVANGTSYMISKYKGWISGELLDESKYDTYFWSFRKREFLPKNIWNKDLDGLKV